MLTYFKQLSRNIILLALLLFLTDLSLASAEVTTDTNANFTKIPLNLTGNDVPPLVMLNVSRDHQLSYKAYNDYSDLDGDGIPETTYQDSIEYYGYFDSAKCYSYDTSNNRFVPAAMATGPNNHYCSGQWSGNFMNWATMTRMDVVRKLLYGGMRSTDTSTLTVLERQYLPTDAHAFAKYYNGNDIDSLTPFSGISTTPPSSTSSTSRTIPSASTSITFTTGLSVSLGDQIKVFRQGHESTHWMVGGVTSTGGGTITLQVPTGSYAGSGTFSNWVLENLSRTGITLANLTEGTSSGANRYSDTNTNPPLIRVARGNFALWTANERWQGYWFDEKNNLQSSFSGFRSNGNLSYLSGINASAENPDQQDHGLGSGYAQGEYIARVEATNPTLLGQEKYKVYNGTYKPIGLLQIYGDDDQIQFGLLTGSYEKNISGGVLRKNISSFANEINSNGTFANGADGIVHNLNKLRLYGYDYSNGAYINRDNCTYQQTGLVTSGGATSAGQPANEGDCSTWGNPLSEMYLESLRYLAGQTPTSDFQYGSGSKDATLGLTVASWSDPLNQNNYCAALNVLNFNASVSSYDGDQMGGIYDLGSTTHTANDWTNFVGIQEGLSSSSWYIGDNGDSAASDDLCSAKNMPFGFGAYSGLCPEAPTQEGTYLMSGTAYYANTNRIRSDLTIPASRSNSRDLMVSTYGIALATNVPKIEVQAGTGTITILPAYRLDVSSSGTGPFGGGTLVDFKIIENTGTYGKFYVNWEDSEMGGDYDQDMWGTIEYQVSGNTITITTDAISRSTARGQGFGYVISGTTRDGAHFHSGIYNFDYTYPGDNVVECSDCVVGDPATSVTYTIAGSSSGVLEDPLLYAAKYGGFVDANGDFIPQQDEYDVMNNSDGSPGADGLPDNYFYATSPLQLEKSLNRVFLTILQRASSGTAAAVVSNNVSGIGALYQAYYEPSRQDVANQEVSWIGTVQALWLDDFGYLREDNDGDASLDGYFTDLVIEQFYDDSDNKTKIRRYESAEDDKFSPFYMQGRVTAFNDATGAVQFDVDEIGGAPGSGPFNSWTVYNLTTGENGRSNTSKTISPLATPAFSQNFTVTPVTTTTPSWFTVGDKIMVTHFVSSVVPFEDAATLWNAGKQLSELDSTAITSQRVFSFEADDSITGGRHIKTWFDDGDGVVQATEFADFDNSAIDSSNFGFLNVATVVEAQDLVDYIRGEEKTGYRNRTINYDGSGNKVMRLADVVNSTPTVVGSPQEALDLLYKDSSYTTFKKQYSKRRQVIYVGSNGGMLHAFNGGFYNSATKTFSTVGVDYNGNSVTEHPLGAEIWAYVPMNLLPHLKWLKDPAYTHVYYVDGKPKVFDAKIFTPDADHPNGWGTVLVVGMRFGGSEMTVDTAADGLGGDTTPADNRKFSSAYIIMDITNPEVEPKLLAEIRMPDGSFTTSYPAALAVKNKNSGLDNNKWFLTFGSGPTDMDGESSKNAEMYILDLAEIASPGTTTTSPAGCQLVNAGGSMKMISCDTGVTNSFVGDPISVDWELDYKADSIYFGTVGDNHSNRGQVMRLNLNDKDNPADWTAPTTLIDHSQPVAAAVTPGIDESGQKWVFFGTGRLLDSKDQLSTTTQSIYGVKEKDAEVYKADLLDTSNAQVQTTGNVDGMGGTLDSFGKIETEITTNREGWYLNLPPIHGAAGTAPATRVINPSALAGGVLFTTAYQPGLDLCTGEGASRLYGLYYTTGTAYPDPAVLGTYFDTNTSTWYATAFVELGQGFATTPSLHTGSGSGPNNVSVFTQLSTGAIIRDEATTVHSVRSGMTSWEEK